MASSVSTKPPRRESERRQATIMFADISGFTAMSEKMDPEEITALMNECFAAMGDAVTRHGGTIDKFMGDCVMAVLGVPMAIEDAPRQAVNTAIEMRKRLYRFNSEKKLAYPALTSRLTAWKNLPANLKRDLQLRNLTSWVSEK